MDLGVTTIEPPFFEIGPKNLLRRDAIEALALAAGAAGAAHGVTVLLTVPTAMIAPVVQLDAGVVVLSQGMGLEGLGPTMDVVTAESLVDAGADGVMLDHDARRLDAAQLASAVDRCRLLGLQSIVCAGDDAAAARAASLGADVVLHEPPDLIGRAGDLARPWIPASTSLIRATGSRAGRRVLAMHAGGVATPAIAEAIMAAGADGTGSTSGVVTADDPPATAAAFIAAVRAGWDRATSDPPHPHPSKETP